MNPVDEPQDTVKPPPHRLKSVLLFLMGCLTGAAILFLVNAWREGDFEPAPEPDRSSEAPTSPGLLIDVDASVSADNQSELPYSISGRVVDQHDEPVAEAFITLIAEDGQREVRGRADVGGSFELRNLALALYRVEAWAQGYGSVSRNGITPGGSDLVLVLEPSAEFIGRAVMNGEGVAGLTILVGASGVYPPRHTTTAADGRFLLADLPQEGFLELAAFGSEAGSGFGTLVSLSEHSQANVEIEPAPRLTFVIDDGEGNGLSGGVVSLSADALNLLRVSAQLEEGRADFNGIPEGSFYARILVPGFLPWEDRVTHTGDELAISLSRGAQISGLVTDEAGTPVPRARVSVVVRDAIGRRHRMTHDTLSPLARLTGPDGIDFWPPSLGFETDSAGRFTASGLPAGHVLLSAEADGVGNGTAGGLDLTPGQQIGDVEVELH